MKRIAGLLLVLVLLGLPTLAMAEEITITHLAYTHSGTPFQDYIRDMAEKFSATHPGIKVEVIIGLQDNLQTMIAAGVAPDVMDLPDFAHFGPQGMFADLKPLMQRDGLDKVYNPAVLRGLTINNSIYTMPMQLAMFITYFNRDLFNQNGVNTPERMGSAWNWDGVISAGKKLTVDRNGDNMPEVFGFDRPWGAGWRLAVLQYGGYFYEFDEKARPVRSLWTSPEVVEAVESYRRIFTEGITPHLKVPSAEEAKYYFWTGNTAIDVQDGLGIIGSYLKDAPFDWDMALLPSGPAGPITIGGATGPSIMKSTKHLNEAWEWVKFIAADKENAQAFSQATGALSALPSVQQSYPVMTGITDKNYMALFGQAVNVQPAHASFPLPLDLNARKVNMAPVWNGSTPPINHLETIHQQKTAIIEEMLAKQ